MLRLLDSFRRAYSLPYRKAPGAEEGVGAFRFPPGSGRALCKSGLPCCRVISPSTIAVIYLIYPKVTHDQGLSTEAMIQAEA